MRRPRVLIVDDDIAVLKFLRANLQAEGYETLTATDGAEALQIIEKEPLDLIILDILMPTMDGFEVCRRVRDWLQIPIIMLSTLEHEADKVKCLDLGADDYLTKPFGTQELMARVRGVFRRAEAAKVVPAQPIFTREDLEINFTERKVTVAGHEVKLTPTEYCLLKELVLNAGKVLTHTYLLNRAWGPEYREEREYLHVFISRLRVKLEPEPANPRYFISVPGVGYQFKH
jgi:two-component system KDP operon response regulator KdpE